MPQMAPLNWLTLLFYFILLFMFTNSMNFYSFLYKKNHSPGTSITSVKTTWKWL
uniref:ATP synthase F0 subunit 8 n=1 Tax=Spastonyx nemognathoides TaxID=2908340 RepID=UPI001EDE2FB1|nr:ATP synthase F0 subunit 8 [Spastonyx nemognathoides]UKE80215.1 ATP synthase F0 subunit 8 [Spastonyx nemognathoides]